MVKNKYTLWLVSLLVLSVFQYLIAESKGEFITEEEVVFIDEDKDIITLSLGSYGNWEGVIDSPDKSLKGLPYEIGVNKYGYYQPYIFPRDEGSSQAVMIPYMSGGGTGVAVGDWCLAVAEKKNVHIKPLGMWHYHEYGPEDDFFSFDILPSFSGAKDNLVLSFLYEERKEGKVQFIKGDIALEIVVIENKVEVALKPCRVEDALKIVDLLTKYDCIKEWAFECLNNTFSDAMKSLKAYEDENPSEAIENLKKKIKRFYDEQNGK